MPDPPAPPTPAPAPAPKTSVLAWTIPYIDSVEKTIAESSPQGLLRYAITEIERFGVVQPTKLIGDDLVGFSNKIRSAIMTHNNTKLRIPVRTFLTHLMQFGPYQLDITLLTRAAVKWAVPEALTAYASAAINRLESQQV